MKGWAWTSILIRLFACIGRSSIIITSISPRWSEIIANASENVTYRVCGETESTPAVNILALAVALELLSGVDVRILAMLLCQSNVLSEHGTIVCRRQTVVHVADFPNHELVLPGVEYLKTCDKG